MIRKSKYNKTEILKEYNTGVHKTARDLGKYLNIPDYAVKRILKSEGIYYGHYTPFKANKELDNNIVLDDFITGGLLGDGCMINYKINQPHSNKNINSKFVMSHSIIQKDYVDFKKTIIDSFDIKSYIYHRKAKTDFKVIQNHLAKQNDLYILQIEGNVYFNKFRDKWYPNNVKTIPSDLKLTNLSLAIWYLDDGYKNISGNYFCTQSFTKEENYILKNILKKTFNINTNVVVKDGFHILYVKADSRMILSNIVKNYCPQSMLYKLHKIPTKSQGHLKLEELQKSPEMGNLQPS